jgi:GNAT superfamily N-acetyltransferase/uncharacterized glyoxalase superfamily protein PhnB
MVILKEHDHNKIFIGMSPQQPLFFQVEPVLAVQNIAETITYWHEVLGFPGKWKWGSPPNHGGVNWQKVFIQFTLEPELAAKAKGNSIWIRMQHIESLYQFHEQKKAEIIYPLAKQPWGMVQYTVRDNNGYFVHFAEPAEERQKEKNDKIPDIKVVLRKPTVEECIKLERDSGNENNTKVDATRIRLDAPIQGVVALDPSNDQIIGYALLLGDGISYYYIKDVLVHPEWRAKQVGTAMLRELDNWLNIHGAKNALVALICREALEPFYQQFGFAPAFSMIKYLNPV